MVEVIANSLEDTLVDGLLFNLAKIASYITDRRSVTFHPQGSHIYSPGIGVKFVNNNCREWLVGSINISYYVLLTQYTFYFTPYTLY